LQNRLDSEAGNSSKRQGATKEKVETFDCGRTNPYKRMSRISGKPSRRLAGGMLSAAG
jgi:hypothetical protein